MDYAVYHFSTQEKLLEQYNFPGLATQRGEHRVLKEHAKKFKQESEARNFQVTNPIDQ